MNLLQKSLLIAGLFSASAGSVTGQTAKPDPKALFSVNALDDKNEKQEPRMIFQDPETKKLLDLTQMLKSRGLKLAECDVKTFPMSGSGKELNDIAIKVSLKKPIVLNSDETVQYEFISQQLSLNADGAIESGKIAERVIQKVGENTTEQTMTIAAGEKETAQYINSKRNMAYTDETKDEMSLASQVNAFKAMEKNNSQVAKGKRQHLHLTHKL